MEREDGKKKRRKIHRRERREDKITTETRSTQRRKELKVKPANN
jgi:hypothetical protein